MLLYLFYKKRGGKTLFTFLKLVGRAAEYGWRFMQFVWNHKRSILRFVDIGQGIEWIWDHLKWLYRKTVGAL